MQRNSHELAWNYPADWGEGQREKNVMLSSQNMLSIPPHAPSSLGLEQPFVEVYLGLLTRSGFKTNLVDCREVD